MTESCSVGIGILLEGDVFNHARFVELELARVTGSNHGLVQPPHVTVKAPFSVPNLGAVQDVVTLMNSVAQKTKPFLMELDGFGNFAQSVIYLRVTPTPELVNMHDSYLRIIGEQFPHSRGSFEGAQAVFHSSVALGLTSEQCSMAEAHLQNSGLFKYRRTMLVRTVGLFLNLNNQWIVVHESELQPAEQ